MYSTSYTFNTETAKHMFCSVCGIKSFYIPRSHPDGFSVNFRCLDAENFHSVMTTEFDGDNGNSISTNLHRSNGELTWPTQILMPALSPTMEEGKLAKWHVKEGDEVHSGDMLAEIETDKATMEFEAVDEGRIGKILVPEGTEGVKVNQPIACSWARTRMPGRLRRLRRRRKSRRRKQCSVQADAVPAKQTAPAGAIDSAMQSIRQALAEHVKPQAAETRQSAGSLHRLSRGASQQLPASILAA